MRNQLFQEQALERLSSPEQLDRLMPLTSPRGWLALAGIGLLLLAGLVWALVGTVETNIKAEGVISATGAAQVVSAPEAGTVTNISVAPGDNVQKGDRVALINGKPLTSPLNGRVLDTADIGAILTEGAPVVSIENPSINLAVVAFVPAAEGYRVRPGMPVSIKPASEDPQSANHMQGTVKSVRRWPATQVSVQRVLQNETWTNTMLAAGPVLQVDIQLDDAKSHERIFVGLPCTTQIVVQRERPIELVLPGLSGD